MANFSGALARAPQRSSGMGGLQVLSHQDLPRLEAFFLALDAEQRRLFFGNGASDHSVRHYCRSIRWNDATVVAASDGLHLEAVAIAAATTRKRTAELSMACASPCDRRPVVADLFDLVLTAASLSYSHLIVSYDRSMPELLALLRHSPLAVFDDDAIHIDVPSCGARIVAC